MAFLSNYVGSKIKVPVDTILDGELLEALDADEFFCIMYLVCTLCKLIIFGYNAIEKKSNTTNASTASSAIPTKYSLEMLISILPVGSKTDIANSFLESLEHCMYIWRLRFETLHFSLILGRHSTSTVDILAVAKMNYMKQLRPFPAVKILKVLCNKLPIEKSVEGVLERIFGVATFFVNK
jgi:hypothetical protein